MAEARRADPDISFNGKSAKKSLEKILEKVEYTDPASGNSDTISIQVYNVDMKFLKGWLPKKGDRITASLSFQNWKAEGANKTLSCGDFLLDEMKMAGGPLTATLGGISMPTNSAIKSTTRTKTWKDVTTKQIAQEVAKRYGLKLVYDGPVYKIKSIEQTDKSDSAFLYDLCKDYGLGMKIYKNKIVIYGKSKYEKKKASKTISRADFIDDDWEYEDTLEGTYTGARTSYKKGKDNKEISIYIGLVSEKAKNARTLKISEQSDSENDARVKAATKVNLENESATTLSGTIYARPEIVAGICVNVKDLGKADGKYFIDEVKTTVTDSGTTQSIQMHKCQKQLSGDPPPAPKKAAAPAKKGYKVGDIVNYHGGTHYYSSYPGAKGYKARAGKAKITKDPNCKGNGHAHPWHLIHTDSTSNVYGWVDEGTFD